MFTFSYNYGLTSYSSISSGSTSPSVSSSGIIRLTSRAISDSIINCSAEASDSFNNVFTTRTFELEFHNNKSSSYTLHTMKTVSKAAVVCVMTCSLPSLQLGMMLDDGLLRSSESQHSLTISKTVAKNSLNRHKSSYLLKFVIVFWA